MRMFCDLGVGWDPEQVWPLTAPHSFQEKLCRIDSDQRFQGTPQFGLLLPDHITTRDQMETILQGCTYLLAQHPQCVRASPDTDSLLDVKPRLNCVGSYVICHFQPSIPRSFRTSPPTCFPTMPRNNSKTINNTNSWILLLPWVYSYLFWWPSPSITANLCIEPNAEAGRLHFVGSR